MSTFTNWRDNSWLGQAIWSTGTVIDKSINLLVNGDFKHTLSAYLGKTDPQCWLCRTISRLIGEDHCVNSAKHEGLIT